MRIGRNQLTYCLNIHPGESLADVESSISTYASRVKASIAPSLPFAVGLRLSAQAAVELMPEIGRPSLRLHGLKDLLHRLGTNKIINRSWIWLIAILNHYPQPDFAQTR